MPDIEPSDFLRRGALRRRIRDPLIFGPILDLPTIVETEPVIWLTLLPTTGLEPQADGALTQPGVHLRWSFAPELPYPRGGFVAERRRYTVDEFLQAQPHVWRVLPRGDIASALSLERAALLSRVSDGLSSPVRQHFADNVDAFQELLSQVRSLPPEGTITTAGNGASLGLRPLDLLHVAALDPAIARGLGVYLVDGALPAGTPADYRVTGKWGRIAWPQRSVYMDALLSQRALAATGFFRLDWLTVFTTLKAVADVGGDDRAFLKLEGREAAEFRLRFEHAVGELELELTQAAVSGEWHLDTVRIGEQSVEATLEVSGTSLFVRADAIADRFDDVILRPAGGSGTLASMEILSAHVRRARGIVGDRTSIVARATPLPNADIEETHIDFPLATAVRDPRLATARVRRVPPALGADGRVTIDRSAVELPCRPIAEDTSGADAVRAVRIDAGYRRTGSSASEVRLTGSALFPDAEILAHWPLADTGGRGRTPSLTAVGAHAFGRNRHGFGAYADDGASVLELFWQRGGRGVLSEPGFLECELTRLPVLRERLDNVFVRVRLMPVAGPERYPTLIGSDYRSSLWLGLVKEGDGFRPRCWVNGNGPYHADALLEENEWASVELQYDGRQVRFIVNGSDAGESAAPHGPLALNTRGTFCIGCDPSGDRRSFDYPFSGFLRDVTVGRYTATDPASPASPEAIVAPVPLTDRRRVSRDHEALSVEGRPVQSQVQYKGLRAAWPLDGQALDVVTMRGDAERGAMAYRAEHPRDLNRRVLTLGGTQWIDVIDRSPEFYVFGDALFIAARVFPDPPRPPSPDPGDLVGAPRPTMTILSADRETSFAFGLHSHGFGPTGGYRLMLRLNGREFSSRASVPPAQWSRVAVAYDGSVVRFFFDGEPERDQAEGVAATLGPVAEPPAPLMRIGGEIDADALRLDAGFDGKLADLELWDVAPGASEPLPSAKALEAAADFTAHDLEDGRYNFWVRGVDAFGRLGSKSYATAELDSFRAPPAPGGARARFLPVTGVVASISLPGESDAATRIDIALDTTERPEAARFVGYDAELQRESTPNPITGLTTRIPEAMEILTCMETPTGLSLSVRRSAFSLLDPSVDANATIEIPLDHRLEVEWTWTGVQRLFAPETIAFHLVHRARGTRTLNPLLPPNETPVVNDEIRYEPGAALTLAPVTTADWEVLQGNAPGQLGLRWLPRPGDDTDLFRMTIPDRSILTDTGARLSPQEFTPETFVQGALVALNESVTPAAWQLFQVQWHTWSSAEGWHLLLTRKRGDDDPDSSSAPRLSGIRFYPGQRYRLTTGLDTGTFRTPTAAYDVAVSARAQRGARTLDSETGPMAAVVAVDRRRPPAPPRPTVTIELADVYGRSASRVVWGRSPGHRFQVYRAADTAVFQRDVELRRARAGHYREMTPEQVFADDPDFAGWIAEVVPAMSTDWRSSLFVDKPERFARPGQEASWQRSRTAWQQASRVWQAWSARFHAGLSIRARTPGELSQLQAIAERPGMEAAFALVNEAPVSDTRYTDEVNGAVRNPYLYRLRAQSEALVSSFDWGSVSEAAIAPRTRLLRSPSFTKIESGERQATLQWALSDEFELAAYVLYRGRDRAVVEDVRYWEENPPDAVSYRIGDPLLRARDNGLDLPLEHGATEILAVHRLADVAVEGAADEFAAFNLYRQTRPVGAASRFDAATGRISGLTPVRNGLPLSVIYRDASGAMHTLRFLGDGGRFVDEGLIGLADYYYAMVCVDAQGIASKPSKVLRVRATDTTPPVAPEWVAGAWVRVEADGSTAPWLSGTAPEDSAIRLEWAAIDPSGPAVAQILVQRRSAAGAWIGISEPLAPDAVSWLDRNGALDRDEVYRLRLITHGGNENRIFVTREVPAAVDGGATP